VVLVLALFVPLAIAIRQMLSHRRNGLSTRADGVLVLAITGIVLLPFIPHDLNGSHFFAERLLFVVWTLPMFAASGGSRWSWLARLAAIGFVVLAQIIILPQANAKLRPVAASIAASDKAPGQIVAKPGEIGLVVEDERPAGAPPGLSFNPFLWAAVNVLRHDDAVMANTPWLDLAIIPLGARDRLPIDGLKPDELEFPSILRIDLMKEPVERERLLSSVDFVLIEQAYRPPAVGPDPLLAGRERRWNCSTPELNWVRVCRPNR
jgi:hypothetical protein